MLFGRVSVQLSSLVSLVVLARILIPSDFGVITAALLVIYISQFLSELGFGAALIQFDSITKELVGYVSFLIISISSLFSILLLVFGHNFSELINVRDLYKVTPLIIVSILANASATCSYNLLLRDMSFKHVAIMDFFLLALLKSSISITLAFYGMGYWSVIIAVCVCSISRTVVVVCLRPVIPKAIFRFNLISPVFKFGGGVFAAQFFSVISQKIDNLIVSTVYGASALGYYSRSFSIMEMPNQLIGSVLQTTLFSAVSKKRRDSGTEDHQREILDISYYFSILVMGFVSSLIFALADEVVLVLLGPRWESSAEILRFLALGMVFRIGYKVAGAFLLASGALRALIIVNLLHLLFVLCFTAIGSAWSISVVALGVSAALGVSFVFSTAFVLRSYEASRTLFMQKNASAISITVANFIFSTITHYFLVNNFQLLPIYIIMIVVFLSSLFFAALFILFFKNKVRLLVKGISSRESVTGK